MRVVPLGSALTAAKTRRAGHDAFPILSMTMHDGLIDQTAKFKKRVASDDTSQYKIIQRDQLVVGFPIDEGVLDFQTLYAEAIVSPAYGSWDVDYGLVDREYLRRFLRSPLALGYYKAKLRGSTARRRSLPTSVFLDLPVPVPPLSEQRRIAAILDQADALRAERREILARLDALPQAVFRQMFEAGSHPTETLGRLLRLRSGIFLPAKDQVSGPYPVFGGNGINGHHHKYMFQEPMVVIGRVGAYCGAVHLTPPKAWVTDNALYVVGKPDNLNEVYLTHALREARLNQHASQSGQPLISAGRLATVRIPTPEPLLQKAFATFVAHVDDMREQAVKQVQEADALFASLQARAFRGEL